MLTIALLKCSLLLYTVERESVGAACIAIMEFKRTCKLPFTAIVALLQLVQLLCPVGNKLPTSKHQLLKFFDVAQQSHQRYDYCRTCSTKLHGKKRCPNKSCLKAEPNSLIEISPDESFQKVISGTYLYM